MKDWLAIERIANQKIIDAQTERANNFVSQYSERSLVEIAGEFAEPFGYLSGFSPDASWLAGEVDSSDENSRENIFGTH